jgi:hypothetical protein
MSKSSQSAGNEIKVIKQKDGQLVGLCGSNAFLTLRKMTTGLFCVTLTFRSSSKGETVKFSVKNSSNSFQ